MNFYPFHIGDYRSATAHLSLLEHGVYRQLIDWYFLDQKPITQETKVVMRRLCARTEEEQAAVIAVLSEFFSLSENGYTHTRCDKEIASYTSKADRARDNGKLGGRPTKTKAVISGLEKETKTEPTEKLTKNQEPRTITKKRSKTLSSDDEHFAKFWKSYPRHVSKLNAGKAWQKIKPDADMAELIIQAVEKQKSWANKPLTNDEYTPHPATWLNAKRWEDLEPTARVSQFPAKPQTATMAALSRHSEFEKRDYKIGEQIPAWLLADPDAENEVP